MAKELQRGFTIIELMMVVAIMGILTALALPAYQDYMARSQAAEALSLVSGVELSVAESYILTGQAPASREAVGLSAAAGDGAGQYVSAVEIANGVITARFSSTAPQHAHAGLDGSTLTFVPYVSNDHAVIWKCRAAGSVSVPAAATLMGAGTSQVAGNASGTLAARFAPAECRN